MGALTKMVDASPFAYRPPLIIIKKCPFWVFRYNGHMLPFAMHDGAPIGFVHVPKTGGTSLLRGIQSQRLQVCNGHAPSWAFDCHPEHRFMTFVRDPYDAAVSGYYFIRDNNLSLGNSPYDQGNYDLIMHESVDYYMRHRQPNQLYAYYLPDLDDIDVVGHLSYPRASRELLHKTLGLYFPERAYNVGKRRGVSFPRRDFRVRNIRDYWIYNQATKKFKQLCRDNDVILDV